jgi:hypothetical protein
MATTIVLQASGPLPLKGSFTLRDSPYPAALVVYGSAFAQKENVALGCAISVNGAIVGQPASIFANHAETHLALVPGAVAIQSDVASGGGVDYTVELTALNADTVTDYNDAFLVVLYH